jgi:hypothetical protein
MWERRLFKNESREKTALIWVVLSAILLVGAHVPHLLHLVLIDVHLVGNTRVTVELDALEAQLHPFRRRPPRQPNTSPLLLLWSTNQPGAYIEGIESSLQAVGGGRADQTRRQ